MSPIDFEDGTNLPEALSTSEKQEQRAMRLAAAHLGKTAVDIRAPELQGEFSKTQIVTMVDGEDIVIQYRFEPLETETFDEARRVYGDAIPTVARLQDEELDGLEADIFAYAMTYISGETWLVASRAPTECRVKMSRSLGSILGRGQVDGSSAAVIDCYVLPRLQRCLDKLSGRAWELLHAHVERLIAALPRIKRLPLSFSHHDLNALNILVDLESYEVSGLIDWDHSRALPFGMGLHRVVDTIAAMNELNRVVIPPGAPEAETAFWTAVLQDAPAVVRENLQDVQDAVHIGALLFDIDDDGELPEDDGGRDRRSPEEWLAAVLTYRLPMLRGDAPAFDERFIVQAD